MPWPGYVKPSDLFIDAGVLYTGATPVAFGSTRGGVTFEPGREMRNPDYDGKHADHAGLDRTTTWKPTIKGKVITATAASIAKMEPGSTSASAGTPAVTTITPNPAGVMLVIGDYLEDVILVYRRQSGGVARVRFAFGIVTKWTLAGQHNNEAEWDIEIEARLEDTETDLEKCPYVIELEAAA